MKDTITSLINPADEKGSYLDAAALEQLNRYFQSGNMRVKAAKTISSSASSIISKTVAKSLLYGDITLPGGQYVPYSALRGLLAGPDLFSTLCHLRHVGCRSLNFG